MKAKKSLGQNFLKSKNVLQKIVEAADLSEDDLVFEIGPGRGALTEALLNTGAKVLALEADRELVSFLDKKFSAEISSGKLILLSGDIRNFEIEQIKKYSPKYKLVANIPYYLTGEIIRNFLSADFKPERAVLLVQKEVADRIVSADGKESILSLSVKAYGKPRKIIKVPARDFSPSPKVDSAVILIEDISNDFFKGFSEDQFFKTIKKAFSYKRKTLLNNFSGEEKEKIEKLLEEENITKNVRSEDLPLFFWSRAVSYLIA